MNMNAICGGGNVVGVSSMPGPWVSAVGKPQKGKHPGDPGKSNEWFTPPDILQAARRVMNGIELDPASCELANTLVQAERYYTIEDDGLSQPWRARSVWLNPPYGKVNNKSGIRLFTDKLVEEYHQGHIGEAILLSTCDSDASWFAQLWEGLICFSTKNVYFYKPVDGGIQKETRHGHWFGTVFAYIGPNEPQFIQEFSQFGAVAVQVRC